VPVRMISLVVVKPGISYRVGNHPSAAAPIYILAAAHAHIFIPVPNIILRSIGNVSGRWRNRSGRR